MFVTVFGGSQCKSGDETYQQAERLGRLLALSGHIVLTGGYIGVMEGVSRGANNAGGHVIGVTCDQIEAWRPVGPNNWVKEERRFPTLRQRLFALIDGCDAAIAMPGGIGTLAEVAEMWSQIQSNAIQPRPIVLIGEKWHLTMQTFISAFDPFIPDQYRSLLTFAEKEQKAVDIINSAAAQLGSIIDL